MAMTRAIVVARPAFAAAANQAAGQVDTDGGERTFTVALRRSGDAANTVRGYWCGWTMTPADVTALKAALKARGATDADVATVPAAQRPANGGAFTADPAARMYLFDAREGVGWTPAEVLAALNVEPIT